MSWGNEEWLWALAAPALLLLWSLLRRRSLKAAAPLPKAQFARAGFGGIRSTRASGRRPLRLCLCLAVSLLVVAAARPRWGSETVRTFERSREVIIAIDVSKSMLAQDVKPSRLARAKLVVSSMLDDLQGESVGLVVFAGTAFLQSPMSPDYQILRGFLDDLNPSFIPQGGTNYTAMLETALDSFEQSDGMADRFLIVISDGESLAEDWRDEAETLRNQNVKAICLGIGTTEGGLIPDGSGGYLKSPEGAVVLTKLEPNTLQELARLTGGIYRNANAWLDLAALVEQTVKRGQATERERQEESSAIERYHYFLAPGLLLLLVSIYREFPSLPKPRTLRSSSAA